MPERLNGERTERTAVVLEPWPFCQEPIVALLAKVRTKVVATTTSPDDALALIGEHRPDVFVAELDACDGKIDALAAIQLARRMLPDLRVIVFSGRELPSAATAARLAGAAAFVGKTEPVQKVEMAFFRALLASNPAPKPVEGRLGTVTQLPARKLTPREREILALVSEGLSNRQAAKVLWVTDQTVKFHLANIYRKLGVSNRSEAARWAREHGLLAEEHERQLNAQADADAPLAKMTGGRRSLAARA